MFSLFSKNYCCWLLLGLLTGCTGPQTDSPASAAFSHDPNYAGKLSRTLMMYPEPDAALELPEEFSQQVFEKIAEDLGTHDLPSAILRLNTDRAERTRQMKMVTERFNPTHALYLNPDKPAGAGGRISFTLRDVAGGKVVWRFQKDYPRWPRPDEVAAEVLKQWRAARLM